MAKNTKKRQAIRPAGNAKAVVAGDARDYIGTALDESFRIGHAVELLELAADTVGTPHQIEHMTDMELQQIGLTLEYLAEQMRGHNDALQTALHKAEG